MARLTGGRCECPTCGACFKSTRAFDIHRIGAYAEGPSPSTRRCMTTAEMEAAARLHRVGEFWAEAPKAQRQPGMDKAEPLSLNTLPPQGVRTTVRSSFSRATIAISRMRGMPMRDE